MIVVFTDKPNTKDGCDDACGYFYKNLTEFEKQVESGEFNLHSGDSVWVVELTAKEIVEYSKVTTTTLKRVK